MSEVFTVSSSPVPYTANEALFVLEEYFSSPAYTAVTLYLPTRGLSRCNVPVPLFTYIV